MAEPGSEGEVAAPGEAVPSAVGDVASSAAGRVKADTAEDGIAPGVRAWAAANGFRLAAVRPLAGDVSPRRYSRLVGGDGASLILASYPAAARAACTRFLASGTLLAAAGVRVPEVLAVDCASGWMLLEDLGEATLAESAALSWNELGAYFREAVRLIANVAALPAAAVRDLNPPLDRGLMARELAQTWELFLVERALLGDAGLAAELETALDQLCARLAEDPPVPCHRDFMARNLMPLPAARLAVLDHQDLRLGPPAYDLASLLNDTLFPPAPLEADLLAAAAPDPPARLRYHRAAAQRTLKAVGSYAAFARRGVARHLPLVAPTLDRFLAHLAHTPEGEALAPALRRTWHAELAASPAPPPPPRT